MAAATGPVSLCPVGNTPIKMFGAFVATGQDFDKGWYLARNASGLFVEATVTTTLLPGGFVDRALLGDDIPTGDDTDLVNVETGVYRVPMLSTSTFAVTDKPGPIYAHNNREFAKSSSGRSIAGLFLCLDDENPTTHCIAWIGLEGAAIAKGIAASAALSGTGNIPTDEWTNPAAVSTTALKAATATQAAPLTISSFVAGGVAALLAYPRNVTFTGGSTTADCPSTVDLVGTDVNDAALLETVALTSGSGTGVKAFKTLTSVAYGAGGGTGGTVAIGIGGKLGLTHPAKTRVGVVNVIREYAVNAVVTSGTYVIAATSPPNGTYAPSSAPDGTRDYTLTYEQDV